MGHRPNFKGLDKSIRKQRIIDTAAYLFRKKGYSSTSLDDISGELGVSKAALYHYVSSKDELLSIIYTQALNNIFMGISEILSMDLPPDEKLRLVIRNHVKNIIIKNLSMFSVFFTEENQLPAKDYQKILEGKRKYNHMVEEIIREGISKGVFKKMDIRLQSNTILGMCNWIYKWYKSDQNIYTAEQIADHFIGLLETGYLKNEVLEDERHLKILNRNRTIKSDSIRITFNELKRQCMNLIKFIEKAERSV